MNAQNKNKHMTQEDRIVIEDGLRLNVNFKQIAKNIGKDQTTVSKEIKRNIQVLRSAKKADIDVFINDLEVTKETELFFCEPYKSCEKPKVEKNHTLFRDICPKGTSFDSFTQEDVNLIFSHVNAVKRKKLDKKSPYEFFAFAYGEEVAAALGIFNIPATEVIESPDLLKQLPSLK